MDENPRRHEQVLDYNIQMIFFDFFTYRQAFSSAPSN